MEWFMENAGLYVAIIGASLAVAMACADPARALDWWVRPLPASSPRTPISLLPA